MKLIVSSVVILLLLALPKAVWADSPLPAIDYTTVTGNEQYIFVMLVPGSAEELAKYTVGPKAEIRQKYHHSGLYRNDGSSTPLWTVDWFEYDVVVSSDGRHVVRRGPWPLGWNYGELALAFYEDGKEIKRYNVDQLTMFPFLLPHSISHYEWLGSIRFNDKTSLLTVTTKHNEIYVFDAVTGNPTNGLIFPFGRWYVGLGLIALLVGAVVIARKARKKLELTYSARIQEENSLTNDR